MMRKHNPVPVEAMEAESPAESICEVLRQIYHASSGEDVRLKCRIATSMAKSMSRRIAELSGDEGWFNGYWDTKEN